MSNTLDASAAKHHAHGTRSGLALLHTGGSNNKGQPWKALFNADTTLRRDDNEKADKPWLTWQPDSNHPDEKPWISWVNDPKYKPERLSHSDSESGGGSGPSPRPHSPGPDGGFGGATIAEGG